MSIQTITVTGGVPEKGTATVTVSPTDQNNSAVTFDQLTNPQWQLMRTDGTVVNDRTFALTLAAPMTSLEFVLSNLDLAIFGDADRGNRVISFFAEYTGTLTDGTTFDGRIVAEGQFNIFRVLGQVDES